MISKQKIIEARSRRLDLLRRQTQAEKHFATLLRGFSVIFRAQWVMFLDDLRYRIVDFYLPRPYRLCIEIDGSCHDIKSTKSYDDWKDTKLITKHRRFRIVRFTNQQVLANGFRQTLSDVLKKRFIARRFIKRLKRIKKKQSKPTQKFDWRTIPGNTFGQVKSRRWIEPKQDTSFLANSPSGFTVAQLKEMGIL